MKLKISYVISKFCRYLPVCCALRTLIRRTQKYPLIGNMGEKFRPRICQLSPNYILSSLKARRSLLDISSGYLSLFPRRCVIVEAVWRPKRSRGPPLWQLVATYTKTPWLLYLVRKMIIFMGLEVNKHAGIWDHHPLVCS